MWFAAFALCQGDLGGQPRFLLVRDLASFDTRPDPIFALDLLCSLPLLAKELPKEPLGLFADLDVICVAKLFTPGF